MLPLPGARSYQDHCDSRVTNKTVPYILANCLCGEIGVIDVAIPHGLVDYVVPHHPNEQVLITLVILMVADKHFVPWSLMHLYIS